MNLADIGRYWARCQPNDVAITFHGSTMTWRELDTRTDEFARGFVAMGIGVGDRVAILMMNRPEWCELALATMKIGAVVVPLNVRFTATEVAFVVGDAECKVVFVEEALRSGVAQLGESVAVVMAEDLDHLRVHVAGSVSRGPESTGPGVEGFDEHAPAFICYTSGTTGDPKGAVLTHRSWNMASQGWAQAVQLTSADRVVLPFPLAFTGGLAVFLFTYWAGARLVLERSVDLDRLLELFETERVTALFAVPLIHQQLVDHPRFATTDLTSWRIASSGGAPVPVPLLHAIQARGVPMVQGFSLTEVSAAATVLPADDALRKVGSAGLPTIHSEIAIERADGGRCASGEIGEILVRGPQVMIGYWNKPAASDAALAGGWLHTGDLGYLDAEGYLYVVDRMKDMLISGGLNVYPAEIERVLSGLPGIVEVCVVGVHDEQWGEVPVVVVFGVTTSDEILHACRRSLADYKLPRYLVFVDAPFPRNMSGKVLKRNLKSMYADLFDRAEKIR